MGEWGWLAWHRAESTSVDELLTAVARSYEGNRRPDPPLKDLLYLTLTKGVELSAAEYQRLAEGLAQERLGFGLRSSDAEATLVSLLYYYRLFLHHGATAKQALHWLLERPPLGAMPTATRRVALRWPTNALDAPRSIMAEEWPIRGAKLVALAALPRQGNMDDADRFRAVLGNRREDPWTRCEAGLRLARLDPGSTAAIAAACLDPTLRRHYDHDWRLIYAERLCRLGPSLLPFIVANLGADNSSTRQQAMILLRAMGHSAVPAIVEALRSAEETLHDQDPDKRAALHAKLAAEDALRAIDPRALRQHRKQQKLDNLGLSRADAPQGEIERGLSRPEQSDG